MRLSYIDDHFSIFRKKKVIIFGTADKGRIIKDQLQSLGSEIAYFCDNDSKIWGCYIDGIEVLSPQRLKAINGKDFIIQIASRYSRDIECQLQEQGITNHISYDEYLVRVCLLGKYRIFQESDVGDLCIRKANIFKSLHTQNDWPIWDYMGRIWSFDRDTVLILCLPPKTGDHTLNASLQHANVDFVNLWHSGSRYQTYIDNTFSKKKNKIITAVREPISQNLSIFFNMAECFWDVHEYWKEGGDIQLLFDSWIEHELGSSPHMFSKKKVRRFPFFERYKQAEKIEYVIQHWFDDCFHKFIHIDLLKYPFDQEKGYSIIREGNKEIFVYQLEKLDQIKDELGEFVGARDFRLVNDDIGENKWYKRAYQIAKKEITLTEKYVDDCYRSDWVQHFYSKHDIQAFQKLWKMHCRNEG